MFKMFYLSQARKPMMLVLGLGLKAKFFGLGLETKSLALKVVALAFR